MSFQKLQSTAFHKPTLILMCGLPASGKTTYSRKLSQETAAIRLCPDEWKADLGIDFFDEDARTKLEARLWELGQLLLKLGYSVILENGFWARSERDALRHQAEVLGVEIEIHFFDIPFEKLIDRLVIRNKSSDYGVVPITRGQMSDYARRFQAPEETELALFTRYEVHSGDTKFQQRKHDLKKNPITIPAINIAEDFLATLRSSFKNDLVGVYLYGSLVAGDFNEKTSDIDILMVIDKEADSEILEQVNDLQDNFFSQHESWRTRFDVAYISIDALRNFKTHPSRLIVGCGDEPLSIVEAPEYYLIDWYKVQEHSLSLYGPNATTIIPHISRRELMRVVFDYMQSWRTSVYAAKNRGAQAYVILALCRSAYACTFGKHVSKRIGAEWVKSEYPQWAPLIDTALNWSRINKKDDIMDESFHKRTAKFVQFMLDTVR